MKAERLQKRLRSDQSESNPSGLVPINRLCSQKQDHSLVVGDPKIITRVPCWEHGSALPNEITAWLGCKRPSNAPVGGVCMQVRLSRGPELPDSQVYSGIMGTVDEALAALGIQFQTRSKATVTTTAALVGTRKRTPSR